MNTDPVARAYPRRPVTGWVARTPDDLLAVLSQLSAHLDRGDDAVAMQLLARVWRAGSPILKRIDEELR